MLVAGKSGVLLVLCFHLFTGLSFTQGGLVSEEKSIDSLQQLIVKETDESILDTLYSQLDKWYEKLTTRLRQEGDFRNAEKYLKQAMQSARKAKHFNVYSSLHNNMGLLLKEAGRNEEAIQYYRKALKLKYKGENKVTTGLLLNNLASLYYDDGQYEKAFDYFYQAAEFRKQNGDPYAADAYWNISFAYLKIGDTVNYLASLERASEMYKEMKNEYGDASYFFTIAAIAQEKGEYQKADEYFRKAAIGYRKLGFAEYVSWAYFGVARAKIRLEQFDLAERYADSSYRLAHQIGSGERIKHAAEILMELHLRKNNFKDVYKYYKRYIQTRDSIQNISYSKALIRSEAQIQYDRKFTADSVTHAQEEEISKAKIAQQETEIELKRNQQIFLFGGLALILVFALFMYNRFQVTKKQKNIISEQKAQVEEQKDLIEHQKHEVEEKNKEITDSINYAKRIQEAILPSRYSLVEHLKNGFVLYKPKDIVAGDFYWLEKFDNNIYFAAADCTGHGVPGAMVSVVCSNALSKALLEEKLTDTGKILDRTRELVIEKFSKSGENVKDGMDISLVNIKISTHEISGMFWSGANNPLWRIRNGGLTEFKPDKQPIGNYAEAKPFTTHTIDVQKGDSFYIFTDGYEDQFGGEKGKKFKAAKMKELFLSVQELSMDDQKNKIDAVFESWKGELEQVDDVCVIGIRI